MKKIILLLSLVAGTFTVTHAQQPRVYTKIIYSSTPVETDEVTLTAADIQSNPGETKFKLKIKNKTADYIIFKPEESKFIINGKEAKPEEKWLVIAPNESDFRVVNLKGGGYNSVTTYSYVIEGLYKISSSTKGIETPDYRLPVTKNDFKTGNFSVALNKINKTTGSTNLKMDVTYNGDKIGFVFPDKAGVKMPDNNEYACVKPSGLFSSSSALLLTKGKSDSFTLNWNKMQGGGKTMDMQFAEMFVKWNDTFAEVTPEKLKPAILQMVINESVSK